MSARRRGHPGKPQRQWDEEEPQPERSLGLELAPTLNYHDRLIEVADECPATEAQVPQARGGMKTKAVIEYELLAKHPYAHTEEEIAFQVYAVLHNIPKANRPPERKTFLSKGHPHLRVSPLAKRYGWGFDNNADGKIALIPLSPPHTSNSWTTRAPPRSRRFAPAAPKATVNATAAEID
jgi:Family of unknown function (DUF6157)